MATTSWTRGKPPCSTNWLWEGKFPLETWKLPNTFNLVWGQPWNWGKRYQRTSKLCVDQQHAAFPLQQLFHADDVILGSVSAPLPGDPRAIGNLYDSRENPHDSFYCLTPFLHHLKINRNKRGFPPPSISNGALAIPIGPVTKPRTVHKWGYLLSPPRL